MREYLKKYKIVADDIIDSEFEGDPNKYIEAVKFYLNDEFFSEIQIFIDDQDYEMAFDALKGLFILAEQFRLLRLYEYLVEVYESLLDEDLTDINGKVAAILIERNHLQEIFNV